METFKVLSDPVRRGVLVCLKDGSKTAGELSNMMNLTPAAMSYHLNKLKEFDLVRERKSKNFVYYELNMTVIENMILWLQTLGGS